MALGASPDPPPGENDLYVIEVMDACVQTFVVRAASHEDAEDKHKAGLSKYTGQRGSMNRRTWRVPPT